MVRDDDLPLDAFTVMSNHGPLLLQPPGAGRLARPLRWALTHPSDLGRSPEPEGRPRADPVLLAPNADPQADDRESRWTTRRAVGSLGVLPGDGIRRNRAAPTTTRLRNQ